MGLDSTQSTAIVVPLLGKPTSTARRWPAPLCFARRVAIEFLVADRRHREQRGETSTRSWEVETRPQEHLVSCQQELCE